MCICILKEKVLTISTGFRKSLVCSIASISHRESVERAAMELQIQEVQMMGE